ncbi:MAG: low molecular weight phosphotyrosine protein phosphatase, partial [Acidihalobacter sp.]
MKIKVLFVCMGNICRSPAAQGVFERLLTEHGLEHIVEVDSAGTHAYHVDEAPDARMQAAAARRGLDLSSQRARRVVGEDFTRYHYILAMDYANLAELQERMSEGET